MVLLQPDALLGVGTEGQVSLSRLWWPARGEKGEKWGCREGQKVLRGGRCLIFEARGSFLLRKKPKQQYTAKFVVVLFFGSGVHIFGNRNYFAAEEVYIICRSVIFHRGIVMIIKEVFKMESRKSISLALSTLPVFIPREPQSK